MKFTKQTFLLFRKTKSYINKRDDYKWQIKCIEMSNHVSYAI